MARIDVRQINRNRQLMADSTIDSPFAAHIEDSDADYGEYLYDNMPEDLVGLCPVTEEEE